MPVKFHFHDIKASLKDRKALKAFIRELFQKENKQLEELQYIFCSDDYLLEINKTFLNHDTYTDVITFDLSEGEAISAEIYISTERIRENAKKFDASFNNELHRVIFHGALHLCGYKDKSNIEQQKMRVKENEYLNLYFKKD